MNTLPYLLKLVEMLQLPDDWHALRAPPVGLFRAFRSYFRSHPMWWLWITNHSLTFALSSSYLFPLLWGGAATCDLRERVEHCAGSGARRLSDCEVRCFRVAWRWAWRWEGLCARRCWERLWLKPMALLSGAESGVSERRRQCAGEMMERAGLETPDCPLPCPACPGGLVKLVINEQKKSLFRPRRRNRCQCARDLKSLSDS
jgi:hypothetical protein